MIKRMLVYGRLAVRRSRRLLKVLLDSKKDVRCHTVNFNVKSGLRKNEIGSLTSKYTASETVEALIALEYITKKAEEVTRQMRCRTQHALVSEVNSSYNFSE